MGEQNRYVLAMYDVRAKQDFIFRTNKLKEIVGASLLIRDVFDDYLFPVALRLSEKGIFTYDPEKPSENAFSEQGFKAHLSEGYIGEVVYNGGGNFLVLFRDEETFRDVTYAFTKDVMIHTGTLRVLGTCVDPVHFDDYKEDNTRLYAKHRRQEAAEAKIDPWSCLPIVQVDRATSLPVVRKDSENGDQTKESVAKRTKFEQIRRLERKNSRSTDEQDAVVVENTMEFDKMLDSKGENSQLAVVYIDGNSMGAKVQRATAGKTSYEDSIAALRAFSAKIQKTYVEDGVAQVLKESKSGKYRIVVSAGDEINFVVKAEEAYECARSYLERLEETGDDDSACVGIAVFRSHAPYAEAYRIAEEACESGKQKMKVMKVEHAGFLDFHICQGAVGMSLEEIRRTEKTEDMSRPWLIVPEKPEEEDQVTLIADVDLLCKLFKKLGRSNVKGLAAHAHTGGSELTLELMRIYAHLSEEKKKETAADWAWLGMPDGKPKQERSGEAGIPAEKQKLIYDVAIAYDLWFADQEGATE